MYLFSSLTIPTLLSVTIKVFAYVLVLWFVSVGGSLNNNGFIVKDYNPCCSMPCLHQGVCTPISSVGYECDCPKGYYGKSCEKSTFLRWLLNKLNLNQIQKQKFVLTGKLIWGVINNIPLLHNAALRYIYMSGCDLGSSDNILQICDHYYTTLDGCYNKSFYTRGLPPVPRECPTPLGVKGPHTLPKVNEVFKLFFKRQDFKPCPFGTNLMFATFTQHLTFQFFKKGLHQNFLLDNDGPEVLGMYESDEHTSRALRSWVKGKLKTRIINEEEYPPYLEDAPEVIMYYPLKSVFPKWAMSHKMFSITPLMFAMATIWLREHNRVCDIIFREHPDWNDERIYQTARWIILGELLTITGGEYFQHLAQYRLRLGYKPHLFQEEPIPNRNQMQYEFGLTIQWHQMMPDILSIEGKHYNMTDLTFSNNRIVFKHGLDAIIDSMSRNPAGQITYRNCGKAFENTMKQLIREGRKARLRSFNDYRRFFDLKPYKSFMELVEDEDMANALEELYGEIDAVEFVVGIFLEKHFGSIIPPTLMFLAGPVALREILQNPISSTALWRPSTFGGKFGFDIVQKATLRKLFCLNLKGNCKNNVWVSFRTPSDTTVISKRINSALKKKK